MLDECRPHAKALDCEGELEGVADLVREGGAAFQRTAAELMGVSGVPTALADAYAREPQSAR